MRVLVVDTNRHDRETAARYLQVAGHEVTTSEDYQTGMTAFERLRPDVVVLDAALPLNGAATFLHRMRRSGGACRAYVVVTSAKPSATELASLISAGADDYMRKPLQREELEMRVGALDRIRVWAAQVFGLTPPDPSAEAVSLIGSLQAWQSVDLSITRDLGTMMGRSLAPQSAEPSESTGVGIAAQIPLTMASAQLEVRLTVGVDAASIPRVAEVCLGNRDSPAEAVHDIVRELANAAGGAFLRAAESEGVELTCGLPVDVTMVEIDAPVHTNARQRFVLASRDRTIRITFDLEIIAKSLRRVTVAELTEGMVLARDLHSVTGALLVPAGTRFTSSLIERLNGFISVHLAFDVAQAA